MAQKMGRPKSENPRNKSLNLRLTESELELINDCAERLNRTRTDIVVEGVKMIRSSLDKKK